MILINRTENDPFFNIAAEEYILKNYREDVFMLWVNRPSVIIGKHQVAAAEANMLFTINNNIPVIRRISGGGTVYHDEGNLNYSLITRGEMGRLVDYKKYTGTVVRALAGINIPAYLENKSSLFTDGLKFSGNAEHVFRKRVLHHGTLLFQTDLKKLRQCIRPSHDGYKDKSVRSIDSKITNLSTLLPGHYRMEDFRNALTDQARKDFPGIRDHSFNSTDKDAISKLVSEKYSTDDWNFGYSPKYTFSRNLIVDKKKIQVKIDTLNGRIDNITFTQDSKIVLHSLSEKLKGVLHHPGRVSEALNKMKLTYDNELLAGLF